PVDRIARGAALHAHLRRRQADDALCDIAGRLSRRTDRGDVRLPDSMRPEPPLHDGQGRSSPTHRSIDGRRSRWTTVDIAPDLVLRILEADDDDQLEAALAAPPADPYAGILWPASIAAAAEIASLVSPGQTVIDLGAGTGLV